MTLLCSRGRSIDSSEYVDCCRANALILRITIPCCDDSNHTQNCCFKKEKKHFSNETTDDWLPYLHCEPLKKQHLLQISMLLLIRRELLILLLTKGLLLNRGKSKIESNIL